MAEKHRLESMPTFAEAAVEVIEQKRPGWRGPRQAHGWLRSLERYVFPRIGKRPVSEVASADVLQILAPIRHVRMQTARTVRLRISAVLEWAVAMNLRNDNPADRVLPVLGPQNEVVEHRRALPHREVAAAIRTLRASERAGVGKLAFEFLILTVARWGEGRGARSRVGRDRRRRPRVDRPGRTDEDEARPPGFPVPPRPRDPRRGAGAG